MVRQEGLRALPIWLDQQNRTVRQGADCLRLRPQEYDILRHLISHAGMLVTKDALFKAVWQKNNPMYVAGDEVITTCIYSLRRKLKDTGKSPRYIETSYKRGYRFIGPIAKHAPDDQNESLSVSDLILNVTPHRSFPTVVGREEELASLYRLFKTVLTGERQIVFVTGEPGIGKTSLVRAFLHQVVVAGQVRVGQGQCVERYGMGEAYMPILEALGRMCREPGGTAILEWMEQHTPTWLVQIPTLIGPAKLEALQRRLQGATRERMLREMQEGLQELTKQQPLVLALEDLHWSDVSTLDLLRALAEGQSRLFIIGTYRPHEGLAEGHPLRTLTQELYGHEQSTEIALSLLNETAVEQYVRMRFPESALPTRFAQVLYQLTDGNPFFLVALVDDLIRRGIVVEVEKHWVLQRELDLIAAEVPENVRQLIGRQIDRLKSMEQRILAASSVAGLQFSAAAVAAATGMPIIDIEETCSTLARRRLFLQFAGVSEWPDGTVAGCYRFCHALYQYLWSERITPSQLRQFHRHIGERLEQAYEERCREIAAELAVHFEYGREYERAIPYLQQAALNAMDRSACQDAIGYLTKGLRLLESSPASALHTQQELDLQVTLGAASMVVKGYAAAEVAQAYTRARELCQQVQETPKLLMALVGLGRFYHMRAEHSVAHELGEHTAKLAHNAEALDPLMEADQLLGSVLLYMGELTQAQVHYQRVIDGARDQLGNAHAILHGQDVRVSCLAGASHVLWGLGYPEQALKRSEEALVLGQQLSHPFSLALALSFAGLLHFWRGDRVTFYDRLDSLAEISARQGFSMYSGVAKLYRGLLLSEQGHTAEGITLIQSGVSTWRTIGTEMALPLFLFGLAWAYDRAGNATEGLQVLAAALAQVDKSGERLWEAELWRLKGRLLLKSKVGDAKLSFSKSLGRETQRRAPEAEACFQKAIQVARRQNAKSLELRAVIDVSQLWREQGKLKKAQRALAGIYNWFTEGFDTLDLREAKTLLDEISDHKVLHRRGAVVQENRSIRFCSRGSSLLHSKRSALDN